MRDDLLSAAEKTDGPVCVVRLRRSAWADKKGVHMRTSLLRLRRRSTGFDMLAEDASCIPVLDIFERVLDLESLPEGVYEVKACNKVYDMDAVLVDYDYRLVPVKQEGGG